jgi:hypothetical protein
MVSWLAKALVQRSIGVLPNPHYWNEFFQKRVTHSLDLTKDRFEEGLCNSRNHLERFHRFRAPATGNNFSAFELGTGWFPTVAIGLFLCGAGDVWTWDINPLLTRERLKLTVQRFLDLERGQRLRAHLHALPERLNRLRKVMALCESQEQLGPAALLRRLGIHYRIGDASRSGLPPQSVDLIVSDVVLEYLSQEKLLETLQEFRRIAAPDAVMSHTISLSDQYSAHDRRVTPFNFLRFSDRTWRWLNNPIIPLNRLRVSDYRSAFSASGFRVVDETSRRGDPADLARTPLAARFRSYPVEDLLVIYSQLVAIPHR